MKGGGGGGGENGGLKISLASTGTQSGAKLHGSLCLCDICIIRQTGMLNDQPRVSVVVFFIIGTRGGLELCAAFSLKYIYREKRPR